MYGGQLAAVLCRARCRAYSGRYAGGHYGRGYYGHPVARGAAVAAGAARQLPQPDGA